MLLVDIGNSRIKWAVYRDESVQLLGEAEYVAKEFEAQLDVLWSGVEKPERLAVASVAAPRVIKSLTTWVEEHWGCELSVAKSTQMHGRLINGYIEPERLGVDRWLAMLAISEKDDLEDAPFCVVDCGSAITIDAVDGNGQHLGGMIVPGVSMMRNALVKGTNGIRLKDEQPAEVSFLARDTEGAVTGGSLYTAASMLDRVCNDIGMTLGDETLFYITGGDAPILMPLLEYEFEYEPNLVLKGLAHVTLSGEVS